MLVKKKKESPRANNSRAVTSPKSKEIKKRRVGYNLEMGVWAGLTKVVMFELRLEEQDGVSRGYQREEHSRQWNSKCKGPEQ